MDSRFEDREWGVGNRESGVVGGVGRWRDVNFQLAVERNKINLLVYDPEREAIVQWSNH
ncbi:hypothetical protein BJP36_42240 [Moorena producens JHB]|uniref:Uncharacterized protein n=1 Tax=Moorena producens (strain JHB) TaxID=1454205 RepID=A0A9Q9SSR6_MOOP1|nr:hypothetical protein [Moorena producens]WAN68984.1 hypothetical protein BJP36_42240 [Moorena producens JHB]